MPKLTTGRNRVLDDGRVAIVRQAPEYRRSTVENSVERCLGLLGTSWSELVGVGDCVVIKPNLIREGRVGRPDEWEQIITNGTVTAAVARGVAHALSGSGTILIADAPQTDSDFDAILKRTALKDLAGELAAEFPWLQLGIVDLRREVWRGEGGVIVERKKLPEAPGGYALINLGTESMFAAHSKTYYGADYDISFTNRHHNGNTHEYLLARSALEADVFINLPKMKTHKKVGVTMSLKNLVGINADKNYLPHFAIGTPSQGGDEFADDSLSTRTQSRAISTFKAMLHHLPWVARAVAQPTKKAGEMIFGPTHRTVRSGNWYGNDTAWRMVLDLNRILLHFDGTSGLRPKPLRYLSIVDGIIGGDGDGPMEADPVGSGLLVAGFNPVAVDMVGATVMGFDWHRIPMIREAFRDHAFPLVHFAPEEVEVIPEIGAPCRYRPHFGWRGQIEAPEGLLESRV